MTDAARMVVWLRETMDAAQRVALAAREGGEGHWHHLGNRHGGSVAGDHEGYHVAFDEGYPTLEQATHIALHDPAAVLRRIAADRKILAAHPYTTRVFTGYGKHTAGFGCETCHNWDGVPEGRGNCATILALAEGYGWTEGA